MLTEMVHMQRTSAKLMLVSRSHLCQHMVLFRSHISFIAASRKQTLCRDFRSMYSAFCCPRLQVTSSRVKCRWKSDSSINAADHLVELGMPQLVDDVERLAANITTRNMNIDISDLVRLFCSRYISACNNTNNKRIHIVSWVPEM